MATMKNRSRSLKPASSRVNAPTEPPTRRAVSGVRVPALERRWAVSGARVPAIDRRRLLQVVAQLLRAGWMAQLAERLGLDLADALTRDAEPLADLFQRALVAVDQAES